MTRPFGSDCTPAPVPDVGTAQPAEPVERPFEAPLPDSMAFRLRRPQSATASTRPEMPAVMPIPPLSLSLVPGSRSSWADSAPGSRTSWADPGLDDPITEQTARATDFSLAPVLMEQRDRAVFLRMDGVHAGQVLSLNRDQLAIGRHPASDLVIDDAGVSRNHATLVREGNRHVLVDLGARNGTLVQGERITTRVELRDGDFVQFGPRAGFRYALTDAKQEKLLHKLYESSNRDALTGAYNRKHFDERLLTEVAFAFRHQSPIGLILFDIDHFKRVNDTYGHAAGDAILRQVSRIAQSRLRAEDVFARIGGEEFTVLLRGVNLDGCVRLAERLRISLAAVPAVFEGRNIAVTISLGCSTLTCTRSQRPADLLRLADERLYKAKTSGRNRTVFS